MPDKRLFTISNGKAKEIRKMSFKLEKELQNLTELNLQSIFGIKFLASEYSTGDKHRGRIDTLGIDENNIPVIIEYKKHKSENIINQGLYYMNWLVDHKPSFEMLVLDTLGKRMEVDWSSPRILCIAEDFTKFDLHAIEQMDKNIELIRYQRYEDNYILFELLIAVEGEKIETTHKGERKTFKESYEKANDNIKELTHVIEEFIFSLGEDIQKKELKYYSAFKRIKNFICLQIFRNNLKLYLNLETKDYQEISIARDVTNIGHYGTGNLELTISNSDDFQLIKGIIEKSYLES